MADVKKPRARKKTMQLPTAAEVVANAVAAENVENSAFGSAFGAGGAPFANGLVPLAGSGVVESINGIDTLYRNLRGYLISNFRQILSYAYAEIGLVQTIVDVPVDDGLRGGVKFKSHQIDESQLEELQIFMDTQDDLTNAGTAAKWNRLYGGAGLVVVCDQDPEEPLDIDAIQEGEEVSFLAADVWELFWTAQNLFPDHGLSNDESPLRPEMPEYFDYYGRSVHTSRVFTLKGMTPPSFIRPRLRGWGLSVVDTLIRSLNQYIKGTDLLFEVLDEFKVDVYRFKNLATTLLQGQNGVNRIKERVGHMNYFKNYQNAVVLDSEDEFDHKQLAFSGLGDAMLQVRMQVAAEMRMPMTKLFGVSSAGFNSGEDDIEVYNAMVEAQVRRKLKYTILTMAKIRCQQLFGMVPDDLQAEFEPLRVLSSEQEQNVKTQKHTRALASLTAGAITMEEFRDICNKGNLCDIMLDNSGAVIADLEDAADERNAVVDGDSDQEPGAAKPKVPSDSDNKRREGRQARDAPNAKEAKTTDNALSLTARIQPWRPGALILRSSMDSGYRPSLEFSNSIEFDKRSYEADGGDRWIDPRRKQLFDKPVGVDEVLWAKAKARGVEIFGQENWRFTAWLYSKLGGEYA